MTLKTRGLPFFPFTAVDSELLRSGFIPNQLRLWIESKPDLPEGDWYKDLGSFKICGHGAYPKTFLLRGQAAKGSQPV